MEIRGGNGPPAESWAERTSRLRGEKLEAQRENLRLRQQVRDLTRRLETLESRSHRSRTPTTASEENDEGDGGEGPTSYSTGTRVSKGRRKGVAHGNEDTEDKKRGLRSERKRGHSSSLYSDSTSRLMNHNISWRYTFHYVIPYFNGESGEIFVKWSMAVDEFFKFQNIIDEEKIKAVTQKMKGDAKYWWERLGKKRKKLGKTQIVSWEKNEKDYEGGVYVPRLQTRILPTYTKIEAKIKISG